MPSDHQSTNAADLKEPVSSSFKHYLTYILLNSVDNYTLYIIPKAYGFFK